MYKISELHEVKRGGASLKFKGQIYKPRVQSVMVHDSETRAMKVKDMKRLERTEKMMVRWMCGVSLGDGKQSEELRERLGIECVSDVARRLIAWLTRINTFRVRVSTSSSCCYRRYARCRHRRYIMHKI
jgi:hypothetical protein